jgi:hypothetical protein
MCSYLFKEDGEGVVSVSPKEEAADDTNYFTKAGVTFLSATGDHGQDALYPATSPNVVAVGGTQLTVNEDS